MLLQIVLLILVVFLSITLYVLFAPILLEIDSNNAIYQLRIVPIFKIWWVSDELFGHLKMSIFGIQKKLAFSSFRANTHTSKPKSTHQFNFNFFRFFALIKSFKIKKCWINIDTGNMPLNGKLYPFMFILSRLTGKTFNINFMGKTEVVLTIRNNAFHLLKAYYKN